MTVRWKPLLILSGLFVAVALIGVVAIALTLVPHSSQAILKQARAAREAGRFENADGPALLHDPLDPDLGNLSADARKFKAPRSLRDIEPPVNLWVKTLDSSLAVDRKRGECQNHWAKKAAQPEDCKW